jgi:hypothetical protein
MYIEEVSWSSIVDAELDAFSFCRYMPECKAGMREMQISGMQPCHLKTLDQVEGNEHPICDFS